MHELSIVLSIVGIAEKECQAAGGEMISSIELDIGELAGIEPLSFDFAWEAGVRSTPLASAELKVNHIPGRAQCSDCETLFDKHQRFDTCPQCGSFLHAIISGEELRVKALTICMPGEQPFNPTKSYEHV